jgi:hypothetical protein
LELCSIQDHGLFARPSGDTPSLTSNLWALTSGGYPYLNELGVSTIWSQLSDDSSVLVYYMVVQNNSNNIIEYAFVEADI